jgi:hypothetical protein
VLNKNRGNPAFFRYFFYNLTEVIQENASCNFLLYKFHKYCKIEIVFIIFKSAQKDYKRGYVYEIIKNSNFNNAHFIPFYVIMAALSSYPISDIWGYIDKTGKIVIEPQFDDARNFQEELA